jgi:hypothetical protein
VHPPVPRGNNAFLFSLLPVFLQEEAYAINAVTSCLDITLWLQMVGPVDTVVFFLHDDVV